MIKAFLIVAAMGGACDRVGDLAEKIMEARQRGTSISTLMGYWDEPEYRAMVLSAFEEPRFNTQIYQLNETLRFREKHEVACYKQEISK